LAVIEKKSKKTPLGCYFSLYFLKKRNDNKNNKAGKSQPQRRVRNGQPAIRKDEGQPQRSSDKWSWDVYPI